MLARELLTQFLGREGFEPQTAADGIEGLRKARRLTARSHRSGCDSAAAGRLVGARWLKGDPELAESPVVMLTIIDERPAATLSAPQTT